MKKSLLLGAFLVMVVPSTQVLGATTGPIEIKDLTAPVVTASQNNGIATGLPLQSANNKANGAKSGSGLFIIMQKLQRYQTQLNELRNEVETLHHQIDVMRSSARDRYMDLDTRINALANEKLTPSSGKSHSKPAVSPEEDKAAYVAARNKLLTGDHKGAAKALTAYIQSYPNGRYLADAHYWLGEVYRIEGSADSLAKAEAQYRVLIQQFPDDSKMPSALYKLARVQIKQGKSDQAKVPLERIRKAFPDSDKAKMAEKLLKKLQ